MADRERFDEMRTLLKRQPHNWSVSMLKLMSSIIDELTELDLRVDPPRLEGYRELAAAATASAARAEAAERERDEALDTYTRELHDDLDAAREALRTVLTALESVRDHDLLRGHPELAQRVSDALIAPHGDDCRKRMYDRRSSPLSAALEGKEASVE